MVAGFDPPRKGARQFLEDLDSYGEAEELLREGGWVCLSRTRSFHIAACGNCRIATTELFGLTSGLSNCNRVLSDGNHRQEPYECLGATVPCGNTDGSGGRA